MLKGSQTICHGKQFSRFPIYPLISQFLTSYIFHKSSHNFSLPLLNYDNDEHYKANNENSIQLLYQRVLITVLSALHVLNSLSSLECSGFVLFSPPCLPFFLKSLSNYTFVQPNSLSGYVFLNHFSSFLFLTVTDILYHKRPKQNSTVKELNSPIGKRDQREVAGIVANWEYKDLSISYLQHIGFT